MSMTENEIKILVRKLFLGDDQNYSLDPNTQFLEAGICDSLGLVQLATSLESQVDGFMIDDQDITRENLGSVAAIERFVACKAN